MSVHEFWTIDFMYVDIKYHVIIINNSAIHNLKTCGWYTLED